MNRRAMCAALAVMPWALADCTRSSRRARDDLSIVFKHQPMWSASNRFAQRIARFQRVHPGVSVVSELLPNGPDALHQYYLTALEGGGADFDVLVVDVIWVREFARAGWIADLSDHITPSQLRARFLDVAAESAIVDHRAFAVPWFLDVGALYYRTDLVPAPPRTFGDLERATLDARRRDPSLSGYMWQGRQSEGLVCNGFEAMWGFGEPAREGAHLTIDTVAAREGLSWLRGLIDRGISPCSVLSAGEEESRRAFQDGRAIFMRNWPYAWNELQRSDSPVRGRVGVTSVPAAHGESAHGALGGWQLAINAHSPPERRALAMALIDELTSLDAGLELALEYGRNPPQRAAYDDPLLVAGAPFIASLQPMLAASRSRPASAYYNLFSDTLQSEFSAVVAGVRSAADALHRAQRAIDHLAGLAS